MRRRKAHLARPDTRNIQILLRVSNVAGLRWLARQLLGNAGGLLSVEKFHRRLKSLGIAIARDTVRRLLGYLDA